MIKPLPTGKGRQSPVTSLPSDDPLANPHIRALACEIAYRLREVCGDLPEGELVKLVTRLAVAHQGPAITHRPGGR